MYELPENQSDGAPRRHWHPWVIPGVTALGVIGGWIWFASAQVTTIARAEERIVTLEHAKDDVATRLARMEGKLDLLVTRSK